RRRHTRSKRDWSSDVCSSDHEVDLKLRGPGDLMGTQQSGVLNLQIADIVQDGVILQEARKQATLLMKQDPELKLKENESVRRTYDQLMRFKNIWSYIS